LSYMYFSHCLMSLKYTCFVCMGKRGSST